MEESQTFGSNIEEEKQLPPELPTEVMEKIFTFLDLPHLLVIRRTCHRFRDMIKHCPALRDKICLRFRSIDMDQEFSPLPVPAASSAVFTNSTLKEIDLWWPSVGEVITSLSFDDCTFLLDILAHTPNLERLEINKGWIVETVLDFKLHKLKKLIVNYDNISIWKSLSRIAVGLSMITCKSSDYYGWRVCEECLGIFQSMQTTLSEINVCAWPTLLKELSELPALKLKSVTFFWIGERFSQEEILAQFLTRQSTIEKLFLEHMCISENMLHILGKALPNLKSFKMGVLDKTMTLCLSSENLEYLELKGWGSFEINFENSFFPNLQHLVLHRAKNEGDTLQKVMQYSNNLRSFTLKHCFFKPSEALSLAMQLEELGFVLTHPVVQYVEIKRKVSFEENHNKLGRAVRNLKQLIIVEDNSTDSGNSVTIPHKLDCQEVNFELKNRHLSYAKLERLRIDGATMEADMLGRVIRQSSNIHSLELHKCTLHSHQLVLILAQLKRLQRLELSNMDLTISDPTGDKSCSNLKFFRIEKICVLDEELCKLLLFLPELTELHLNYYNASKVDLVQDELIVEVSQKCKLLEKFSLDNQRCISLKALYAILKNCHRLKEFNVWYANYVNYPTLKEEPAQQMRFVRTEFNELTLDYFGPNTKVVQILGRVFPELKCLTMSNGMDHLTTMPSFVDAMINLEYLKLDGCKAKRWLIEKNSSMFLNLKELELVYVSAQGDSLRKMLENSLLLRCLKLKDCSFEGSQLMSLVPELTNLEILEIFKVDIGNSYNLKWDSPIPTLKYLKLSNVTISDGDLCSLFRLYPSLTELYLDYNAPDVMIPDETIAELSRNLTQLETLVLEPNRGVSMASAECIIKSYESLKKIVVCSHSLAVRFPFRDLLRGHFGESFSVKSVLGKRYSPDDENFPRERSNRVSPKPRVADSTESDSLRANSEIVARPADPEEDNYDDGASWTLRSNFPAVLQRTTCPRSGRR